MAKKLKGNAIFLHVPKTGGSWVRRILLDTGLFIRSIGRPHADVDRVFGPVTTKKREILRYYFKCCIGASPGEKPFLFCFVRHPLSWYESWFKFMGTAEKNWKLLGDENDISKWHPQSCLNGLDSRDFNTFVRNVVKKRPGYVTEMFSRYTCPPVAFIGKQENLTDDLITVLNRLDLDFDEDYIRTHPKINVSSAGENDNVIWDPDLRKEVYRLEYAAIRRYGYDQADYGYTD